ncbi:biotin/lipoyl attachment domain-containing protein [Pseudonocardia dioxanivorans CB1190]|uniref:Biotin/lipoyl attachment domain-containing protein n=1 Tax=Pseudonocardia dioxanivorans (strain ATCC 55486 / DSM 44775 / JCM 13855 / CB1190) TaxID=675635 RepID=F4CNW1_PSEUX|nr:biotin/lipoyl-binding carrier protein [Pseudonocardia dioxanivorans]AEA22766.1 biotin/lipoyl attachment domain-containing protein [Pseudonocardia dioxanivorans CB1190]
MTATIREEVRAELVASVLEVSATAGVRVAGGQAIVLLESMKMEIPVVSETGGTVVSVAVAVGDVVQSGDLIAVVDAGEPEESSR